MKYRMVIFDLDGTLLDTLKDIALSVNAVLDQFGFKKHPISDYRYLVGEGMDKMVKKAFPVKDDWAFGLDNIVNLVKEEYGRRYKDHTVPYAGIEDLLQFLEERGTLKAVFSNKPHDFAVTMVKECLGKWHFEDVVGIREETPRKPNPEGALKIVKESGFAPGEILYLGDTGIDMQTAVSAGFFPVGVLWGFREAEELKENGAKMLIKKPADLKALFK